LNICTPGACSFLNMLTYPKDVLDAEKKMMPKEGDLPLT
jgi:hypothetical protein